jgi:hypothetical protein
MSYAAKFQDRSASTVNLLQMEERSRYYVQLEEALVSLLLRVVSRPRNSPLDPPVPLQLIQNDVDNLKQISESNSHIEQAARSCVIRIAVSPYSQIFPF